MNTASNLKTTAASRTQEVDPSTKGLEDRVEALKRLLPERFEPYSDKYFLRTHQVLEQEGHNPWVRAQVFVRKGPGKVGGVEETLAMLDKYTNFRANGGRVFALPEGSNYGPRETMMVIEGRVQDIIALETLYLGAISAEVTRLNEGIDNVNTGTARDAMRKVVSLVGDRPVIYMGARHWSYRDDAVISAAAFEGGASECSTDAGGLAFGKAGIGTIPHALENIYAWIAGQESAVVEATLAFDRVIDPAVPRVALIDYNNRELDDSVAVADALQGRLSAVRVDTCGENVAQGALISPTCLEAEAWRKAGINLPTSDAPEARFWYGTGVTVTGVYALRKALDQAGHKDVKIILSSGFADPEKVEAFVEAEKTLGVKLFDALGVGGIMKPCRMATMDIVAVGDSADEMTLISKVGRPYNPNPRLIMVMEPQGFAKDSDLNCNLSV
jgi:nicotinate phosphoribosyltransferase